jgi:hypothetical protein
MQGVKIKSCYVMRVTTPTVRSMGINAYKIMGL